MLKNRCEKMFDPDQSISVDPNSLLVDILIFLFG